MPEDNNKHRRELIKSLSIISQIGFMVAACLFIGVMSGRYLDRLFGTSPWLLLLFSLLGMGAAFKSLFDFAKKK